MLPGQHPPDLIVINAGSPFGVLKGAFHKIALPLHERQAFLYGVVVFAFGIANFMFGVGFIIGPVMGGLWAQSRYSSLFLESLRLENSRE